MQRQSLGSPSSKQQKHHHYSSSSSSPSSSSSSLAAAAAAAAASDDDVEKKRRRSKSGPTSPASAPDFLGRAYADERKLDKAADRPGTEKSIHLIPLLTFLCFLVLYLVSHDPSPKDLESFGGFGGGTVTHSRGIAAEATRMERLLGSEVAMSRNRKLKEIRRRRRRDSGDGAGGRKLGGRWRL